MTIDSSGVLRPSALHLCTTHTPCGGVRVHLAGELDRVAAGLLAPAVAVVLRVHRSNVAELDLRGVRVLSNAGASALSDVEAMAHADGITVIVDATRPELTRTATTSAINGPTRSGVGQQAAWPLNQRRASWRRWQQLDDQRATR